MIRVFLSREFLRFVGVGATAAGANWAARIVASHWLTLSWSVVVAYCVGMAVAFALNSAFVFPGSPKPRERQAFEFIAVNLCFLPVVWLGTLAFDHVLRWTGLRRFSESIAHVFALAIPMFGSFLVYKFLIFKGARSGK
jgi:putative flippase GtrA